MPVNNLSAKGYLIDLDGTLICGGKALPDAAWLLSNTKGRFIVVSNNAEHTPAQLARVMSRAGLEVGTSEIVLAGTAAIDHIAAEYKGVSVLLLGSLSLKRYAASKGLVLQGLNPDIVLVARDRQFSYSKLQAAANALVEGAKLIVAAPDFSHPGPGGKRVPETGSLAAAILACAGARDYTVIGKPERAMFELALSRLGVAPEDSVMIGDNPLTDGLGAQRLGMDFWEVQNGMIRHPGMSTDRSSWN